MARLYDHDGLLITDDWIRVPGATFSMSQVRDGWVARRSATRGGRLLTTILGSVALLMLVGGAAATGWLARNWIWLLAAPGLLFVAGSVGLLDPIAIYLEKRHHELWISVDSGSVPIWRGNVVECRKALRQIQRAQERQREAREA
jgi:hypothetical protein